MQPIGGMLTLHESYRNKKSDENTIVFALNTDALLQCPMIDTDVHIDVCELKRSYCDEFRTQTSKQVSVFVTIVIKNFYQCKPSIHPLLNLSFGQITALMKIKTDLANALI